MPCLYLSLLCSLSRTPLDQVSFLCTQSFSSAPLVLCHYHFRPLQNVLGPVLKHGCELCLCCALVLSSRGGRAAPTPHSALVSLLAMFRACSLGPPGEGGLGPKAVLGLSPVLATSRHCSSWSQAYGAGSGADCRRHVQKLNLLQARLSEGPHRYRTRHLPSPRLWVAGWGAVSHCVRGLAQGRNPRLPQTLSPPACVAWERDLQGAGTVQALEEQDARPGA